MISVREHDLRDGWYLISPQIAGQLLDEQPMNRPLREAKAQRFGIEMRKGLWRQNGEPIILDEHGKLLDGQGRLRACLISGKPFETYIIHGIPRKFFPTIDIGQIRGGGDTLSFLGSTNSVLASAICKWAIVCENNTPINFESRTVSNDMIRQFYERERGEIEIAINFCRPHFSKCPISPSVICYVVFQAFKINQEKAKTFALGVLAGTGLAEDSPMLVLRNRMIAIKGEAHILTQVEKLAFTIKAWNSFIEGKPMTILKWSRKGKNKEVFPWLVGEEDREHVS